MSVALQIIGLAVALWRREEAMWLRGKIPDTVIMINNSTPAPPVRIWQDEPPAALPPVALKRRKQQETVGESLTIGVPALVVPTMGAWSTP